MTYTTGTDDHRSGGWIQVLSGAPFWPLDPRPEEIDINDIAWALSMQCRFAGHVTRFYSVAEHSILVSQLVPAADALWGLLHDATEAYLQDLVQPLKADMPEYRAHEDRLMACIAEQFGLPGEMPRSVKEIDRRMLFTEKHALLRTPVREWGIRGDRLPVELPCWQPYTAYTEFLSRFLELTGVSS